MPVKVIFGGGSIGGSDKSWVNSWATPEKTTDVLQALKQGGIMDIDAGASYPAGRPWHTETLLGQAHAADNGFQIHTKIAVHMKGPRLDEERITTSLNQSMKLTGVAEFPLVYAHYPDEGTPMEVTVAAFHTQYLAGKFEKLGLCNYSVAQLNEYFAICDAKGYIKPSVVQDMYNPVYRKHEANLFPLLRKHNVAFYAFSPFAGGFMSGKVTAAEDSGDKTELNQTRWGGNTFHRGYNAAFNRPVVHQGMRRLKAACEAADPPMTPTEASLRWLLHHSALRDGDGVIIGASTILQIEKTVESSKNGPLGDAVLAAVEAMWDAIRADGTPELSTYRLHRM